MIVLFSVPTIVLLSTSFSLPLLSLPRFWPGRAATRPWADRRECPLSAYGTVGAGDGGRTKELRAARVPQRASLAAQSERSNLHGAAGVCLSAALAACVTAFEAERTAARRLSVELCTGLWAGWRSHYMLC